MTLLRKLGPIFLDKKSMCFSIKTCNLCKTRIKSKQVYRVLEFDQSQWLKLYVQYNTEK